MAKSLNIIHFICNRKVWAAWIKFKLEENNRKIQCLYLYYLAIIIDKY